jgi:hypothetical protein
MKTVIKATLDGPDNMKRSILAKPFFNAKSQTASIALTVALVIGRNINILGSFLFSKNSFLYRFKF